MSELDTEQSNYECGVIYKLTSENTNDIYIGFTGYAEYVDSNIQDYVKVYNKWKLGKGEFISYFRILQHEKYKTHILETCYDTSKRELCLLKNHYIKNTANCINNCDLTEEEKNKCVIYRKWKGMQTEKRKEQMLERRKRIGECKICGNLVRFAGMSRHQRSLKCKTISEASTSEGVASPTSS
jgi:hypothetical protein